MRLFLISADSTIYRSHNYSFTAFAANREKTVIVNSTELADRLEMVDKDWGASVS